MNCAENWQSAEVRWTEYILEIEHCIERYVTRVFVNTVTCLFLFNFSYV